MVAADELAGLLEAAHLLRSPKNAARLLSALRRALDRSGGAQSVATLRARPGPWRGRPGPPEFREDLRHWVETDRRVEVRALPLIEAIMRDPFDGIGKPEPPKHLLPGLWSLLNPRNAQEASTSWLHSP
jgi:hypothetical protein